MRRRPRSTRGASPARGTSAAISIAAAAASRPLLPAPSPARASASSTELVVSTPNAIGTPVVGRRRRDAVRDGRRDVFEVRRLAANQAAEADDRVEPAALGRALRRQRNLERARHAHHRRCRRRARRPRQRRARAPSRSRSVTKSLNLRHDDREPEPRDASPQRAPIG